MNAMTGGALYLDLIKKCLTGMIYGDPPAAKTHIAGHLTQDYIPKMREYGRDYPSQAHTMIGMHRLSNIQYCIEQVLADGVPGDLIETGLDTRTEPGDLTVDAHPSLFDQGFAGAS